MMRTRCPTCATTFRVTPEQLKAKHGKVRCGQCQNIFNALDTLLDAAREEPIAQPEPAPAELGSLESACEVWDISEEQAPEITSTEPVEIVESTASEAPDVPADSATEPEAEADFPLALPTPPLSEKTVETDGQSQEIEPLLHEENEPQSHGGLWALAAFLALGLLLFQAVLQFRVDLAVAAPETKPMLQSLCTLLGCDLPLPRKIGLLGIDASDLHPNPRNPGQLVLTTTLKNRAPFAQAYPLLELALTDTTDQPILRKILTPAEYLPKTRDMSAGFVAGGEIALNLVLIPDGSVNAVATGYRLYLFYP